MRSVSKSAKNSVLQSVNTTDWLILITLSVVWGSSFILIKKGLAAYAPIEMATLRIVITALAFVPIFFFLSKGRTMPREKLPWAAAVGILGSGLPAFLFAFGETRVASSIAGMLNSLVPIFTLVFGLLLFGTRFVRKQLAGVLLGLFGAVLIIALQPDFRIEADPYTFLIVGASVSYALSGNIVKTHFQDVEPVALSSIAFFFIGVPAVLYSFQTDIYMTTSEVPGALWSLGAIAILSLIGTAMANILFYRLVQRTNAVFATSVSYLIPLTAMVWGLVDGEEILWTHLLGIVFILAGIWSLRKN